VGQLIVDKKKSMDAARALKINIWSLKKDPFNEGGS
jgi:hypothetical protein